MAYDKIIPIKGRLDHCVNYVLNPEKTDLGRVLEYMSNSDKTVTPDGRAVLETAINCQLETAHQEMLATKRRWSKKGGVLGYHLIHSYAPGEVTPEQAHTLGVEFAHELLGDRYEVVISTHLDHDHLHNHILFNSVLASMGRSTGIISKPTLEIFGALPMRSAAGMACRSLNRRVKEKAMLNGMLTRKARLQSVT